MHNDEMELEASSVNRMLAVQFPRWSDLSIRKIRSSGTDNTIYRLGENYSIRLPKRKIGILQIEKEKQWLPYLSDHLPLEMPQQIAVGKSSFLFPHPWGIYKWIKGEELNRNKLVDIRTNIEILINFIKSLHSIEIVETLKPGFHNGHRGGLLKNRDKLTRAAIPKLKEFINPVIAEQVWEEALNSPIQPRDQSWIHGDIHSGNILSRRGKIISIIDYGTLAVGDKACDLMPAWNLLNTEERRLFRKLAEVDDLMWKRGKGWSLSIALVTLDYYLYTNPGLSNMSKFTLQQIESDYVY